MSNFVQIGTFFTMAYLMTAISGVGPMSHSIALADDMMSSATKTIKNVGKTPTDMEIAQTVMSVHQTDIDAGKLAKLRSQDPRVKEYANQMITDHSAGNREAMKVVKKMNVKPLDSDTSRTIRKEGKENLTKLETLEGSEFDKAYIDREVDFHQDALNKIDKDLMPNAKSKEMRTLVSKVRPEVMAHLQHAKDLQQSLQQTTG